jgi:membrane-associated HD superfamily phosphohydrolase
MPSNSTAVLDNVTSLNQTITNLANQTITNLANQTITNLNKTVSEQARLTDAARENTSRAITQQTRTIQGAFEVLPNSIYAMLMAAIVLVIAFPVGLDLFRRDRTREERYDLYRAVMTFGVIVVVGIVVVYLIALINFNILTPTNVNVAALIDVLKNLSTIVGTALAAIVAFYFGTRSAQGGGAG